MALRIGTISMLSLCLQACAGSASVVRQDAAGGELALHGPFMLAAADARGQILDHCGGPYALTHQDAGDLTHDSQLHYACMRLAPVVNPMIFARRQPPDRAALPQ
jgi:hypothetical protein